MEYNDINARIAELVSARNRKGKPLLTTEERVQMLEELYDASLCYLTQCIIAGSMKGTGALTTILERARLEAQDLKRLGSGPDSHKIEIMFKAIPNDKEQRQ